MTQDEQKQKAIEAEERLYASIGEFVVEFELVCEKMRHAIVAGLTKEGLRRKELAEIFISEQMAEPLRRQFGAVYSTILESDSVGKELLSAILNRLQKLISERNRIVHGTWDIGWKPYDAPDLDIAEVYKPRTSLSEGLIREWFEFKEEDFNQLTKEARALTHLIYSIQRYAVDSETYQLEIIKKSLSA